MSESNHPFGSGTAAGAGFGNKTSSSSSPPSEDTSPLQKFTSGTSHSPYKDATSHGSGTTSGAGFGNKTGSYGTGSEEQEAWKAGEEVGARTESYAGATEFGSGSTGGAGWGNKTAGRVKDDSTRGKVLEKVGGLVGSEKMEVKGQQMREAVAQGAQAD